MVFRAIFGAFALGGLAWLGTRKLPRPRRRVITVVATIFGVAAAPAWKDAGTAWGANLLNWLQDGSTLTRASHVLRFGRPPRNRARRERRTTLSEVTIAAAERVWATWAAAQLMASGAVASGSGCCAPMRRR